MMRFCFIWLCRNARELQKALEYTEYGKFLSKHVGKPALMKKTISPT